MKLKFTELILILLPTLTFPQTWLNYFSTNEVYNVRIYNNILWAATPGGIIKYNIETQAKECFNRENGKIPINNVRHIENDKSGNIYFCSYTIFKYDELVSNNLTPPNSPFAQINDSDVNSKGEIWFVELWKGVFIYDGNKWSRFYSGNSILPGTDFYCVKHDKLGNTWVGTGSGLFKYDGANWVKYDKSNSGLPSNIILDLAVDRNNNIWMSATDWTIANAKLMKFDGINWVSFSRSDIGKVSGPLYRVAADSTGNIWVSGQADGLSKYDGNSWKFYSNIYTKNINDINADKNGNIWLASKEGLFRIKNEQYEKAELPGDILPSNKVWSTSSDVFGNRWIATGTEIGYLKNNKFTELTDLKYIDYNHSHYRCLTTDSLENVWIGYYLGGILKYDRENYTQYSVPNGNVSCMTTDKFGNIWVGYYLYISKISGSTFSNYNKSNIGIAFETVYDILCTDDNVIWIATSNSGLIKYSNNQWNNITKENSNLPSNTIYSLAINNDKNLVVGTASGLRIFKDGVFSTLSNGGVLNSNSISDVAIDSNGSIFVIMAGCGLVKYTNDNIIQYQTDNSPIQYYDLNKVEVDCNDNVWIASEYGLSVFNEKGIVFPSSRKVQLSFPKKNQQNLNKEITFNWNQFENAESYTLQIATDSLFNKINFKDSLIYGNTKIVSTLLNSNKYYWRVRAKISNKYSEWSYVWNFTTMVAVPAKPILASPETNQSNQTKNITFKWNKVKEAEKYFILLSKDLLFATIEKKDSTIDTTKTVTNLLEGQKYYWKIQAKNVAGLSSWSDTYNFSTLITPPSNLELTRSGLKEITLKWKDNSNNEKGYLIDRRISSQSTYLFIDSLKTSSVTYIDNKVEQGITYYYKVRAYTQYAQSDYSNEANVNVVGVNEEDIPHEYSLRQNYPNPFNPSTSIVYEIPQCSFVTLEVYDILGQKVAILVNEEKSAGRYNVEFNAEKLSSGIYIYLLRAKDFIQTKKMLLIK